ncbi:MAG: hypothetical protein WD271_05545 [Acidimicrobiia bacterium]
MTSPGRTSQGKTIVPKAQPVPAAPPNAGEVLRHGAQVGLGALGLARNAIGSMLNRAPTARTRVPSPPGTVDLVPGAILGLAIVAERRARVLADTIASGAMSAAGVATRPRVVQRALRPLEDQIWRLHELARREQARNQGEAAMAIPVIIQQITENVIAQLDLERIVQQIPMGDIVGAVDIEAIVARIDLVGVIRESTSNITTEAVDALRDQGMALDAFAARVVDGLLFRKRPRKLDVGAS